MSRYHNLDADLELLNLGFAESGFGDIRTPYLDDTSFWDIPGYGLMNNAYGNYELNQAVQLSEYLLPSHLLVEDVSPLPPCLYEPTLATNLESPWPVSTESDEKTARFTQGGEEHLKMNSVYPDLLHNISTAAPIASDSQTANAQEPPKRGRGRPKGSKTKQRHPAKPRTPEEKAQAKSIKAAIRLARKEAAREAKKAERKEKAAAKKAAKQAPLGVATSIAPQPTWE
ncbi:hypothetical protein MMC07_003330 [Pseudocyphellaria aurata]|nr:hypothetical protein [Pseudocyphellaria aurata]